MMPVDGERAALHADLAHREALLDLFYLSRTSCARDFNDTLGYLEVEIFHRDSANTTGDSAVEEFQCGMWLVCDG